MKSGAVKAKEEKIPDAPKKISFERTAARSMDSLESEPTGLEGDNFDDEDEEDEEWLKPKIFRPNPDKLS